MKEEDGLSPFEKLKSTEKAKVTFDKLFIRRSPLIKIVEQTFVRQKRYTSPYWVILGDIQIKESGDVVQNLLACKKCSSLFRYNGSNIPSFAIRARNS